MARKELIATLMALAAFAAVAVLATSVSAVTLTQPTGTGLATESTIIGTNIGNTVMTSNNPEETKLFECPKATMIGAVNSNSGTVSATITSYSIEGTAAEGRCTASGGIAIRFTMGIVGGLPYCMKSTKEDRFDMRGGTCAEAARSIKYTMDFSAFGGGSCGYEVEKLTGTFTTDTTGDAIISSSTAGPFKRFESAGFVGITCPETMTLNMSYTLEAEGGSAAYFS